MATDNHNYRKLQKVLEEIFELNQADLDFGIYRIMNQKREEINDFLENRLLIQVKEVLIQHNGDNTKTQAELDEAISQAKNLGVEPDSLEKVKMLKAKLATSISVDQLEQEVYSHLANFFKRYYKDGDFISLRRYKKDTYAIPYEGEEVKLHWANHDQYYIKTSEHLKNYGFKLSSDKKVKFELKEASTEQNNNKEQKDQARMFELFAEQPYEISEDGKILIINFTYDVKPKSIKQDKLIKNALSTLLEDTTITNSFPDIYSLKPTDKNKNRTLLEKHINDFTARNSFDYFIHKDLGGFLSREIDFYIKNEVLFLDDINTENEIDFTSQLSKVKALKQVAQKIIKFLAQIEDFQKKLWLKKKFVVSTNYLITLDKIPEKYYPEITENKNQLIEWKELFKIDQIKVDLLTVKYSEPLSISFLKDHPYLTLDTKFFTENFKDRLLSEFDNLDKNTNGLLINSENFQAISLLESMYKNRVRVSYIDPPYNTKSTPILYKNEFKHSSWLSLIENRLKRSKSLLSKEGIQVIAIDDAEMVNLSKVSEEIYNSHKLTKVSVIHNPKGSITRDFNRVHEYSLFLTPIEGDNYISRTLEKNEKPRKMRRWGENSLRTERQLSFYPIYVKNNKIVRIGEVPPDKFHPMSRNIINENGEVAIYPIDQNGIERRWNFGLDSIKENLSRIAIIEVDKTLDLFLTHELSVPKTVWSGGDYDAGNYGNTLLINMFGEKKFDFPKSIKLVEKCIDLTTKNITKPIVLDYFSGSGTTGHATIKLNRKDEGDRKYILVEMGTYFNFVTKPRIQKAVYSDNWKNGKSQDKEGISQIVKYHDIESYEDALNNLTLKRTSEQKELINNDLFKDDYMLSYMLDVEAKDSLLNIDAFKNPFNYKLNITRNNESEETVIDLVETFNYLIGLHITTLKTNRGFKVIEGVTNITNEQTLVIWRNTEEKDNSALNEFFTKMEYSTRDTEFDRIYVNGDNHLENLKIGDEKWKVVLIEEEFQKRMFDIDNI